MGKNGFPKVRVTKKLLAINPCSPPAQFRHAPSSIITISLISPTSRSSSFLHLVCSLTRFIIVPPTSPTSTCPPSALLPSRDISVANDLQRQGQRQPYQTAPAVEQIPLPAKNEAFRGLPFFLVTLSICSQFSPSTLLVIIFMYLALKNRVKMKVLMLGR